MASRRSILRKLDELEPGIARVFRDLVHGITSSVKIGALEEAIRLADIEAAIDALGISGSVYSPFFDATRSAFVSSGVFWANDIPKRLNFGFDVQNPRAERWVRENGAELVARDIQDKRQIIQDVVSEGIASGKNPKTQALDLAGRISRQTGRRTGGQIVLSKQQAEFVRNAASDLRQNTPSSIGNYLKRKRRDRRFDNKIKKALESGVELSDSDIAKITGRYSDRLLQLRAETIARTETLKAFNKAGDESLRQLVDAGHVQADQVRKIWDATLDQITRPTHAQANGQVVGLDEPFIIGGFEMMHPHDDENAPASEIVDCRCFMRQDINFITDDVING